MRVYQRRYFKYNQLIILSKRKSTIQIKYLIIFISIGFVFSFQFPINLSIFLILAYISPLRVLTPFPFLQLIIPPMSFPSTIRLMQVDIITNNELELTNEQVIFMFYHFYVFLSPFLPLILLFLLMFIVIPLIRK